MVRGGLPPDRADRGLSRRFLLLLLAAVVPLVLLLLAQGARTYERTSRDVISRHEDAQLARQRKLEEMVGRVRTHVAVMLSYVENRLHRRADLPPWRGRLDWSGAASDPGPDGGGILSPPGRITPDGRRELTAVEPIFALARASHAAHPFLRWSYYFSALRDFTAIYPWAPPQEMLPGADPTKVFDGYFDYDVFALGEPRRNPTRTPYWTPVYWDAGGAGLIVTYAAPVWDADTFLGIVGTDVLLSTLSEDLARMPAIDGVVVVLDQTGHVVATSIDRPLSGPDPVPAGVLLGSISTGGTGGRFEPQGDLLVSVVDIAGTPWRMVMTIPGATITDAVLEELWPHAALLAGILATFATFAFLFGRHFVGPAVAIANYGALTPQEAEAVGPPTVPDSWRGLSAKIRASFAEQTAQVRQMRAMIDGIPLRAVYVDAALFYRDANREFLDFVGRSRDQVIGRRVREVLGALVEEEYRRLAPSIRRGDLGRWEGWIDFLEQGRRYLQVSVLPFTAAGETEPGFLTFTRDLTELKKAEHEAAESLEALASSEALHRSIVLSALDGIIVMDGEGITREFNPAAEAMFGRRADRVIGKPIADVIIPPALREAHRSGLARYLSTGLARVVGRRIEVTALHADGSELPVELTVTEVMQGEHRLFTSHIRDLREQKRLAREIEAGRERLHHVEKLSAMGSLLASVAHELNNPLAIVIAQSTLLASKADNEGTRQRAERIRAAADRCGRIVKSFLAMARQKPPVREPLDMDEVVRNALEMLGYGLRSSGVEVETELARPLPTILADRDLMSQVVSNLLLNAQQALVEQPPPRRIRIRARREGDMLAIQIADNGPGVSPEIAARIFDPYFTTKAAGVGTGIGLSISRNIVASHGGELRLAARPEGGAAFEIRLPVSGAPSADSAEDAPAAASPGLDILIVDDEPDVAASLAEMADMLGHRATVVDGPAAALALVEGGAAFDVLLTDLRMPGIDGVSFLERLAQVRPQLARRAVVVTGDTVAGPSRLAALGRTDIVTLEKPFGPDDVAAALERVQADA
ncbi:PAS domain S-box protein [Xanthobacter sp. V4C-4]|uniref:PAS domain S-box protein n=1 Tax=Xanthobacter cornucopiae TaxID=3119924 RepID=UPI00372B1610